MKNQTFLRPELHIENKISWYIRPEIQKEFGGYLSGIRMIGKVISVHNKHIMVRQDNIQRELKNMLAQSSMVYAVDKLNKSIKIIREVKK